MNVLLIIAGCMSACAAIMHVVCIYIGPAGYRFFGAGEKMAKLAEQGSTQPAVITSTIAVILSIWSLYAFSAASMAFRMPLMRWVMSIITMVYLTRGIVGFFLINTPLGRSPQFWLWSSAICLTIGIVHLIGVKQQWQYL